MAGAFPNSPGTLMIIKTIIKKIFQRHSVEYSIKTDKFRPGNIMKIVKT